jgi:hypothetical protein
MKIAYLITAYNNYHHLKRLVSALNDSNVEFFIHIDKKSTLPDTLNEFENVVFIPREKVWWAGWSQVAPIIRLIRTATSSGFDYYVLLSGTDYPIRPNSFLYDKLSFGGEFISFNNGVSFDKPEERIKYYYFDGFDRRNKKNSKTIFFLVVERTLRVFFQKTSYPFKQICYGPAWWALSHDCLVYLLKYIDNNENYVDFYKTSLVPDESFFHTIIAHSPFLSACKKNLTYTDWGPDPFPTSPALINRNHIDLFKKQREFNDAFGTFTPFFARKFDDSSANLIELIEKELRN